ncbi:MAG: hypothetical protein Q9216_001072 [Gyalolechia sp. 2 TL-2023]
MCHHEIEKFTCGHDEKHKIPCETFCESGSCSKPGGDQIRDDAGPKCNKCKDDEDEADFIQEELRKFAERESLNTSTAPTPMSRDPNAPKLFFKRCIVWSRCGHHSHPRPSDIERDEGDPEYLHVEGLGNCFDCSAASPSIIAKMKQDGNYEKEDPWDAMSTAEVGEGSSRGAALPSLEEIGQGVTHDQVKEQGRKSVSVSPPSSPERTEDRANPAASSEPGNDSNPAKGKGVPGRPPHPLSDMAKAEDVESDTDSEYESSDENDDNLELDEESEVDEEETDLHGLNKSKKLPGHRPRMSGDEDEEDDQGQFSDDDGANSKEPQRGRTRHRELGEGVEKPVEAKDDELATPEELKEAGLPGGSKMLKSQVQRVIHRKLEAGKLAMLQHNKNEVE